MPLPPAPRTRDVVDRRRVLMLTNEDILASTIVPRLNVAGADLDRISFIQMVRDGDGAVSLLTLGKDLDALEDAIKTEQPALVVIDGLVGYLGPDVKSHNDADVRRVLSPFAALLARTGTAGLGLMHPPKVTTNLHYYAGGSVAFTAVPRVVLGIAPDPDDDGDNPRRFLVKLKGNLYGRVPTLAYRITAENDAAVPRIEWEPEPVTVNICDVFSPPPESPEDRGNRRQCEAWLERTLAEGPKPAQEMEKAADAAGFKPRTLRRARERVCDSFKDGIRWVWFLQSQPREGGQ
jgi:putative DNA primase/helicase